MFFEDSFDEWYIWEFNIELAYEFEDLVDFVDDFFAASYGVVVGFMEVVGGCIQELDETMRGQFGDNVVGVFLGDVQLVVLHEGRTE